MRLKKFVAGISFLSRSILLEMEMEGQEELFVLG